VQRGQKADEIPEGAGKEDQGSRPRLSRRQSQTGPVPRAQRN
jgi:hypothetical protein